MFKVGDYLVCRREVCKVVEIKEKHFREQNYYILEPMGDNSLTIQMPTNSNQLRKTVSKKEVEKIIDSIPNIEVITAENDKMMENIYKELIKTSSHEDLIRIIKTTFLRNKERIDNNKKTGEKDNTYFEMAEKYLYNEFAAVLNMSFGEVKDYVETRVIDLNKEAL